VKWHIIQLKEVQPTPWRNGGGMTRELATWPDASHWIWRVSVAEVTKNGPFSHFDDVQRWFAVLDGNGVVLTIDGKLHCLTQTSMPLCFDGAATTECDLINGQTQDFNLMMRAVADAPNLKSSTTRMTRVSSAISCLLTTTKIVAIYAQSNGAKAQFGNETINIPAHSLAWCCAAQSGDLQIIMDHGLLVEMDLQSELNKESQS
jgi:uncharacterized protein